MNEKSQLHTATKIPINSIWADPQQPRRAIPIAIRRNWNGNPHDVPDLLSQWHSVACRKAGINLQVEQIIQGQGDGIQQEDTPLLFRDYLKFLLDASTVYQVGLMSPIRVVKAVSVFRIVSGERRWLFYHLLAHYCGDEWAKIPATIVDQASVEQQAVENIGRQDLNAISMARQLALWLMDERTKANGAHYEPIESFTEAGQSERRFYAQVADGNKHRVPSGSGQRLQSILGLKPPQVARYRKLLNLTADPELNDVLWMLADGEHWSERVLRVIETLPTGNVWRVVQNDHDQLLENLQRLIQTNSVDDSEEVSTSVNWIFEPGEAILDMRTEELGQVIEVNGDKLRVEIGGTDSDWQESSNYLSLGVTWDEYLKESEEADSKSGARVGSSAWSKAARARLQQYKGLAVIEGNANIERAIDELLSLSEEDLLDLEAQGSKRQFLDARWDQILRFVFGCNNELQAELYGY